MTEKQKRLLNMMMSRDSEMIQLAIRIINPDDNKWDYILSIIESELPYDTIGSIIIIGDDAFFPILMSTALHVPVTDERIRVPFMKTIVG